MCDQPKYVISCKIDPPRTKSLWYYDKNKMKCRKFKADECSGNNNNFSSRKSCNKVKATCGKWGIFKPSLGVHGIGAFTGK